MLLIILHLESVNVGAECGIVRTPVISNCDFLQVWLKFL